MTSIAQRRVAGATALMILLYLVQVALFASPSQADTHHNPNDVDYWYALYPDAVGCWSSEGPYVPHGSVLEDEDGNEYVVLDPYPAEGWVGDHWEVLIVKGGAEDVGDGNGNAVYDHPEPGVAYYPPENNGERQPDVSHWIACKAYHDTTSTTKATTTTTVGETTTTVGETTTTVGETTTTVGETTTTLGTTTTVGETTTTTTGLTTFDVLPEEEEEAAVLGTTITTAPEEVSAETLPFTGFESGDTAKLGLLALLAGGLMLFAVRGRRGEEEPAAADLGGWSTF
jgi:hypothetical protein